MTKPTIHLGRRAYTIEGSPELLGAHRHLGLALGRVRTVALKGQYAVLFVGHNRGRGHAPHCAQAPEQWPRKRVTEIVLGLRASQVGLPHTGATVYPATGWYGGDPEHSSIFQFLYVPEVEGGPPPAERSYGNFAFHMNRLAERVAYELCQSAVYVLHHDGTDHRIVEATSAP